MGHAHDDLAKQRCEAAVSIERETQIAGLCRQTLDSLFVQTEVQHRIHHSRHRERRAGTNRNEQRILGIAKLLADLLFNLLQAFLDLFPHAFGKVLVVFEERVAGFGGDDQSRRHGQSGARHFAQAGAFAAEQLLSSTAAFFKEVDPFVGGLRFWASSGCFDDLGHFGSPQRN